MAKMYFSKFNVNSNIDEVYKKEITISEILKDVFHTMDEKQELIEKDYYTIQDEKGDRHRIEEKTKYKFFNLHKDQDKMIIGGRLLKLKDDKVEKLTGTEIEELIIKDRVISITFLFDLKTELIAFTVRKGFGYNQFNEHFQNLINSYFEERHFEIFLENNIDFMKEEVKKFQWIGKVEATIIPPNSNDDAIKELLDIEVKACLEDGIGKKITNLFALDKVSKGVKKTSAMFKRFMFASANGYGNLILKGTNSDGDMIEFNSKENVPYTKIISDDDKHNIVYMMKKGEEETIRRALQKSKSVEEELEKKKKEDEKNE